MPKNKPNKGLLKRIRFTKSGKVKRMRACGRHLRSHKSGKLLRSYRKPAYVKAADAKRMGALLHMRISTGAEEKHNVEKPEATEQE